MFLQKKAVTWFACDRLSEYPFAIPLPFFEHKSR